MYCRYCDKQIEDDSIFCRHCGKNVNENQHMEILSTEVTDDDHANAWTDKYGVKYSPDKKRLLCAPKTLETYAIPQGTVCIADKAFKWCSFLESLTIPNSVIYIGDYAFMWCKSLQPVKIPNSVTHVGKDVFLNHIKNPY